MNELEITKAYFKGLVSFREYQNRLIEIQSERHQTKKYINQRSMSSSKWW